MPDYDFTTLSPPDFESLTRDLLQEFLQTHVESFKGGADKGIDLRYATVEGSEGCIIQCKHYARSGFSKLLSDLKNKEKVKIHKLRPSRYIISTSVPLSPGNKSDIQEALYPHIKDPADIFGKDDLNNLLGLYEKVERRHIKLWMTTTNVLERVLHAGIFNQTEATLDAVRRRLSLFVEVPAFRRALRTVSENGVCILTGSPGVGKTTIAEMVMMAHLARDWSAISLSVHVSQAFSVLDPGSKQIFYYDDFLGQTPGDKLEKGEEPLIRRLIEICASEPETKRFILTARDYILNAGKIQYERYRFADFDQVSCTVGVARLGEMQRSKILANHLYFYSVPEETVGMMLRSKKAHQLVRHRNFNPRIIEEMCRSKLKKMLGPERFIDDFIENLNNPVRIWEHAFESDLGPIEQSVLLTLVSLGSDVEADDLQVASDALCGEICRRSVTFLEYKNSLKVLRRSFVRVKAGWTQKGDASFISLRNPSIRDFLKGYVRDNRLGERILAAAQFWPQTVFALMQIPREEGLGPEQLQEVIERTFGTPSVKWAHRTSPSPAAPSFRSTESCFTRANELVSIADGRGRNEGEIALAKAVKAFESIGSECDEFIYAVYQLYSVCTGLASRLKIGFSVDPVQVANWMVIRLSGDSIEAGDFMLVQNFLEENLDSANCSRMLDRVRRDFEEWCSWTEPGGATAAGLEYEITEIKETADSLEVDVTADIERLTEVYNHRALYEEAEARDLGILGGEDDNEEDFAGVDEISLVLGALVSD